MISSTNGAGKAGHPHVKKRNLDTPYTLQKNELRWITDLKAEPQTIKLLEDNIGENLSDFEFGDDFLDTTPETQSMKEKIDKLDFNKIKNFHSMKDTTKPIKDKTQTGRKSGQNLYLMKDWYPKYTKNS